MNDAIALAIFQGVAGNLEVNDNVSVFKVFLNFLFLSGVSIIVGVLFGLLAGILLRMVQKSNNLIFKKVMESSEFSEFVKANNIDIG